MKTKLQIAQELHNKILEEVIGLEIKVRVARLENKNKEKEFLMIERDYKETELKLLDFLIKELNG